MQTIMTKFISQRVLNSHGPPWDTNRLQKAIKHVGIDVNKDYKVEEAVNEKGYYITQIIEQEKSK